MPSNFEPIIEPVLILVEGQDDKELLQRLLRHPQVNSSAQILIVEGKSQFRPIIKVLAGRADFKDRVRSLVIMRDVDDNPTAAFKSVQNALTAAKLPVPREPETTLKASPFVSVFIAPDTTRTGSMETLCMDAIADPAALACVAEFLNCADGVGLELRQREKTKFYAYLAARPYPVKSIYAAVEGNHISFEYAAFARLRDFLSRACFIS